MNMPLLTPVRTIIPESAPFTPEQQAWLNGFFEAVLSTSADNAVRDAERVAAPDEAGAAPAVALADNDSAPWHDPSLPLDERLAMAAGKPLAPRLMAAMAQQDCGQCGYNCADYANALFLKKEERLTLCAPGGRETARALKQLAQELGQKTVDAPAIVGATKEAPAPPPIGQAGRTRDNPVEATFLSRRRLNGAGSAKTTWHVEFDLSASGLDYVAGDSFGVFPKNPPALADQVVAMLGARPEGLVRGKALRDALIEDVSLGAPPDALFQLLSYVCGGDQRRKARALASGEDPDGDAAALDVLATLNKFSGVRPGAEAFVEALDPLQPRLYSISSSIKANPGRISLTVDGVRYRIGPRERLGVASTFLGERLDPGQSLKVYVQKAHGFRLPDDPKLRSSWLDPAQAWRRSALSSRSGRRSRRQGRTGCSTAISGACMISSTKRSSPPCAQAGGWRACRSHGRAMTRRNSMCRTGCASSGPNCGAGSRKARIFMSAATPSAWRRTSSARSSTSSRNGARARRRRRSPSSAGLKKSGRYQADVY